jgi:hypothetical protein
MHADSQRLYARPTGRTVYPALGSEGGQHDGRLSGLCVEAIEGARLQSLRAMVWSARYTLPTSTRMRRIMTTMPSPLEG